MKIAHGRSTGSIASAKVVLAGLTGFAKPRGWTFLDKLYRVRGIKRSFDVAALHPYAATIGQFGTEIKRIRRVMKRRHDGHTALWLTEVGWGSDPSHPAFPAQQGPARPEADAAEVVQAGSSQAKGMAYPATVLVRLA